MSEEKNYNTFIYSLLKIAETMPNTVDFINNEIEAIDNKGSEELNNARKKKEMNLYAYKTTHKEEYDKIVDKHNNARKPYRALRNTIHFFSTLWHMQRDLKKLKIANWENIRKNIYVGFINETDQFGDTSFSMGAATEYFDSNKTSSNVVILNCETNGIKYQTYTKDKNNIIYNSDTYNPKNKTGPNTLNIPDIYKPKESIEHLQNKLHMIYELSGFISGQLSDKILKKPKNADIPIYAFVTDTIRGKWETEPFNNKTILENNINEYFGNFAQKFNDAKSHFITQNEEADLELTGADRMYDNLAQASLIDKKYNVIGTLGFKDNISQFVYTGLKENKTEVIRYLHGTNDEDEIFYKFDKFFIDTFNANDAQTFIKKDQKFIIVVQSELLIGNKKNDFLTKFNNIVYRK